MESEWKPVMLEVMPYKETGTFIMKVSDDCSQLLDDHIVMAQSMSFSPYKKPFEERITTWESKLVMTQDVMDEWLQCQRQWLYLEPIFSSEDINRQLPVESKRYQTMERIWRKVMTSAKGNPQVKETIIVCFEFKHSFYYLAAFYLLLRSSPDLTRHIWQDFARDQAIYHSLLAISAFITETPAKMKHSRPKFHQLLSLEQIM